MISARVLADTVNPTGSRLTTFLLRYPLFIHAQVMTHRVFSRNAASARAVPIAKTIRAVEDDHAAPIYWGENQAGMQPGGEVAHTDAAKDWWARAAASAVQFAKEGEALGLHKQIVNRVLAPFSHIEVVLSSTHWANWYELRLHPDAQAEIQKLAFTMQEAQSASTPSEGGWHLPFVRDEERADRDPVLLAKLSAARCARVSYLTHDGKAPHQTVDLSLFHRLVSAGHWSPLEHQACPASNLPYRLNGNFDASWEQFRQVVEANPLDFLK